MSYILFLGSKKNFGKHSSIFSYFVLFCYIVTGVFSGYISDSLWLGLVAFSLPAASIGEYYAQDRTNSLFLMTKYLDVLFVVLSASVVSLSMRLTYAIATGDSNYSQRLSYYAALCFLLDIFLFVYGKSFERFRLFKSRIVRWIYYCMLPAFIAVIFFSGGRGGFVVVAVGTIAILFTYKGVRLKSILSGIFTIIAAIMLLSYFSEIVSKDVEAKIQENQKRVLAYINIEDSEGQDLYVPVKVDVSQSSGRDIVYRDSWRLFLMRPVTGYGLFNYKKVLMDKYETPYPHNLFLEWLLQGGIFFFFIWFFVFCKMILKLHRLIKYDRRYVILLPFLVYAIVQLMFSGTYMDSTFFWFALSFSFNKKVSNHRPLSLKNKN